MDHQQIWQATNQGAPADLTLRFQVHGLVRLATGPDIREMSSNSPGYA